MIESKVDYNKAQNLILTSVILIIGVSGAKVNIGAAELKGMALATIVGIGLSLIFKLIGVLRPEEVVLDAEDADITTNNVPTGQCCCRFNIIGFCGKLLAIL
ncbi:hypothetical protein ACVXHA_14810 [Escherichia coli]